MAYTMSASGNKADVIGQLRQQAAAQSANLTTPAERDQVTASVNDAEAAINQYSGDADQVSVTVSGNISQSDPGNFAMYKSVGVTVQRGAAAAPSPTPAPAPAAGVAGTSQPTTEPRI